MDEAGPPRVSRRGCGCSIVFLVGVVVLAVVSVVVPDLVLRAPAERLPKAVLRWRNGGGVEIARGTIAGHPWFIHAKRGEAGRTCAYILHDTFEDRLKAVPGNEDPLSPQRRTEQRTCGLVPIADRSGLVGALGGMGFSRYRIPQTREWLLFGVVPGDVRTVTVAARGRKVTVSTFSHPDYRDRFFVVHRPGFGPGESSDQPAKIIEMTDARKQRVRVYWS